MFKQASINTRTNYMSQICRVKNVTFSMIWTLTKPWTSILISSSNNCGCGEGEAVSCCKYEQPVTAQTRDDMLFSWHKACAHILRHISCRETEMCKHTGKHLNWPPPPWRHMAFVTGLIWGLQFLPLKPFQAQSFCPWRQEQWDHLVETWQNNC